MNYKQIKKLSPVRITYGTRAYLYAGGVYCADGKSTRGRYIEIGLNIRGTLRKLILLHEIGHAVCHAKNCKCMGSNSQDMMALSEYHAWRFCMKQIKNDRALKKLFIKEINGHTNKKMTQRIMKLKQWAKFCDDNRL